MKRKKCAQLNGTNKYYPNLFHLRLVFAMGCRAEVGRSERKKCEKILAHLNILSPLGMVAASTQGSNKHININYDPT